MQQMREGVLLLAGVSGAGLQEAQKGMYQKLIAPSVVYYPFIFGRYNSISFIIYT